MRILGKPSSINVRKVLWTCEELSLDYSNEAYGSGFQPTDTPDFRAMNPNAMVPVLIDSDFVLWESNTICRYLAGQAHRMDLLPSEPKARARVEKWMDWQATELNNSWRYAFMALVRQSPNHRDSAAVAHSVAEWNRHMVMVETQLQSTGTYMAGEAFTLADIVIGLSVHRWSVAPIEHQALPAVAAYYERLGERPAFMRHGRNGM